MFAGYGAQIDWPGAHVWRELAVAYPDAKVIHSVRPEESWWNSFSKTIGKLLTIGHTLPPPPPHVAGAIGAAKEMVGIATFGGEWADREVALATIRQHDLEAASVH